MVERVFWHVGLPKSGSTYLQQIVWDNRDLLASGGLTVPGRGHRDHLWAALDLSEVEHLARRNPQAPGAWGRIVEEVRRAPGDVLLTHEFFCGAQAEQVRRAVADLAPAEVHVLVTARDAAGLLAAGWQESVKNGGKETLAQVAGRERGSEFSWWTWDLAGVLERFGVAVPPERIHVLPLPDRSEDPDQLWTNFARVLGVRARVTVPRGAVNQSLGLVQVETLRRLNHHLTGVWSARNRGVWIRGHLAEHCLAAQSGERLRLDEDLLAACRTRSERAVDLITARGIDVVGDLERLRVGEVSAGRTVDSVQDSEVVDAMAVLADTLLGEVRELRAAQSVAAAPATGMRGVAQRVRRALTHRRQLPGS